MSETGRHQSTPSPDGEQLPRRFGKYTLIRKVATGGMAELFLAIHRSISGFEKLIVIKQILGQYTADPEFVRMFMDEAKIAATLDHPNIIQIFDVGVISDRYFIAMEYIHGEDLRSIVKAMVARGMREFPREHAIQITMGVCAALDYAHTKKGFAGEDLQIVHRDVSPQNILVTFTGDVKLVDFGIAKAALQKRADTIAAGGTEGSAQETGEGQLRGKFPYMSPEQCRAEPLDQRSDVFSLGIILFELTTGRRLFKGKSEIDTIRRIVEHPYPRPTQVRADYPPALEAIVMKALARNRDERYASARQMQADLEQFVREQRVATSSISLSNFMHDLFAEKLAAQRQAMAEGKQLADVVAAEAEEGEIRFEDIADVTGPGVTGTPRATHARRTTGSIAIPAPPKSRLGLFLGVGAAVAVTAAAAIFLAVRGGGGGTEQAARVAAGAADAASETGAISPAAARSDAAERRADAGTSPSADAAEPVAAPRGVLLFTGVPAGMKIFVDGKFAYENRRMQTEDAAVPLVQAGNHVLRLEHPEYVDEEIPFMLPEEGLAQVRSYGDGWIIDLSSAYVRPLARGEVYVALTVAEEGADLRINGAPVAYRPGEALRVRATLVDGEVKVEVTRRGYDDFRRVFKPDAASPEEIRVAEVIHLTRSSGGTRPPPPPSGTGTLRIRCTPYATVLIPGEGTRGTPFSLDLPARTYALQFANPESGLTARRSVTILPGETVKITECW